MDQGIARAYIAILREELVPAMGCTEPIAVAYAAAAARRLLGRTPETIHIRCSANIVKNVKGVTVPNTGGLKGIAAAAAVGALGGDPDRELQVLQSVTPEHIEEANCFLASGCCTTDLAEGKDGIYVEAILRSGSDEARVVIEHTHTGISLMERNGTPILAADSQAHANTKKPSNLVPSISKMKSKAASAEAAPPAPATAETDRISSDRREYSLLNVRDILEFAATVNLDDIAELMRGQIRMNSAIADEGLSGDYGVSVGKNLLKYGGNDLRVRARARAAAGSDARMGGCALPVVINSGSGNQGLTVSLPVIEYAAALGCDEEKLIRALVISNLVSLEQKEYIGKLSAYCGAVSAAVGSAAAIAWLKDGTYEQIAATIINAIATADGILCDGAKSSCAAKIATALEAAIMAHEIGMEEGKKFADGEGLVGADVEATIRNVGQVGSVGMRPTDLEIIKVMLKD